VQLNKKSAKKEKLSVALRANLLRRKMTVAKPDDQDKDNKNKDKPKSQ